MRSAAICLLLLGACDDRPAAPPIDASVIRFDAATADGAVDGGGRDAGERDGGERDAGTLPSGCVVLDDPPLALGTDTRQRDLRLALVGAGDHFGLAWVQAPGAQDEVRFARIPSRGAVPDSQPIQAVALAQEAALARAANGEWWVAWSDTSLGAGYDVRVQRLAATGAAIGAPTRITDGASREDSPSIVARADGALIAWSEHTAEGLRSWIRPLGLDGVPTATAVRGPDAPIALARGVDRSVALWALDAQAWLQAIDATGALGERRRLDTEANVTSAPVFAALADSSAVIFVVSPGGARSELRFRPLDAQGRPAASERALTIAPESGTSAGIAAFATGYAAAYRAREDGAPVVRVALLDTTGERAVELDIASTSEAGGAVAIAAAADGRLAVVWATREATEATRVSLARVECGR